MRHNNTGKLGKCLAVAMITGLAAATTLAEKEAEPAKNNVLVTATRMERKLSEIPSCVTVLHASDLLAQGLLSVPESLQLANGIVPRTLSENPASAILSMRGFSEKAQGAVLVLVDGHRLNRPDMASVNWLQAPLNNIERIEVMPGSAGVLYGDQACAGIINIVTRKEVDKPALEISAHAGSFNMHTESIRATAKDGKTSYAVFAGRTESDEFRDNSDYLSFNIGADFGIDIGDSSHARLSLSYQEDEYGLPGGITKDQWREKASQTQYPDDRDENDILSATAFVACELSPDTKHETTLTYTRRNADSDMVGWMSYSSITIDGYGVSPKFTFENILFGRPNTIVAGIDARIDRLEAKRFPDDSRANSMLDAVIKKEILGAYAVNEWSPAENWLFGAGIRSEIATFDAKVSSGGITTVNENKDHNETVFDLSLVRSFGDFSKIFIKGGTLYRYPFVDEQVSFYGFGTDQFFSNVTPEEGWNLECGGQANIAKYVTVGLTMFHSKMKDEIAWNNNLLRNENLEGTRHSGVEVSTEFKPCEAITVSAGYTFTAAEFTKGANKNKDIPLVSKHSGTVRIQTTLPMDLMLDIRARFVGSAWIGSDYSNYYEKLDSYTVADAFVRYTPKKAEWLTAYVGVENIFDENYASLGYVGYPDAVFYPAPKATFKAGINCKF